MNSTNITGSAAPMSQRTELLASLVNSVLSLFQSRTNSGYRMLRNRRLDTRMEMPSTSSQVTLYWATLVGPAWLCRKYRLALL